LLGRLTREIKWTAKEIEDEYWESKTVRGRQKARRLMRKLMRAIDGCVDELKQTTLQSSPLFKSH